MKDRLRLTAWAVAGVVVATTPALADETVLAASKARKLQVLADGGAGWCKPTVRLRMVLDPDSPDARNPGSQVEVMNRLKAPITTDCKAATAAELTVVEQGKPTGTYKATADKDWVFAAVPASAPVAAPKAEPPPATAAASVSPPAPAAPPAVAPQVVTAPPSPAPTSAPPAGPPLPRDVNYASAMIRLVKDNPSLAQDDGLLRCWAAYRFEKEYSQFRNQEFKLQPVLQKARADLAETVAQNDGQRVTAVFNVSFDGYNFDTQQFPISLRMESLNFSRQCYTQSQALPSTLIVKVSDLDAITGLPMESKAAQAFADKRTRYGSVDRHIAIAVTVKLDNGGFVTGSWGQIVSTGTLESATIFADSNATQPLYWLTPEELEKMRATRAAEKAALAKAEEERKAEQRRQQMLAQREQNIRALSSAPTSVKLANWVSDGQIDYYTKLNNLRTARAAALVGGKPVMVSMLIQADGSGRNKVDTKWPGKLEVTVAEGQPDLSSSGWYLVRGMLSVPEGDNLPPARLTAQTVYACAQPKCADATEPTAIVDRKLAALTGAN